MLPSSPTIRAPAPASRPPPGVEARLQRRGRQRNPSTRPPSPCSNGDRTQPNVTLRELMAAIGHSSPVAALRYQHATAERSKAIATYLDDVIESARSAQESA